MKRIGCLILVIILCTVITSCKANNNAAINYETLYNSQPIVYQSGSDLYIVKEDNKPQKIVSGKFEPVNNKNITNFMFDVNGIFRISYDNKWLAFAQTDKKVDGKISLQLANASKEEVTQICDNLSIFMAATSVRQLNPFKFATNGDLYYLMNNENNLTTDLYIYKNGKSKLVVSNVINFYISQDNKKIMYTSGNEYTEENKPKQISPSGNFMTDWYYKYNPSSFTLNLYDVKTGKTEIISKDTECVQFNYDIKNLSFIDYYEKDSNGAGVRKHYGAKSQYDNVCDNCHNNGSQTWHIDDDTHIVKDDGRNGWFLGCCYSEWK